MLVGSLKGDRTGVDEGTIDLSEGCGCTTCTKGEHSKGREVVANCEGRESCCGEFS